MGAGQTASGVPLWVWFLLAGLVLLGVRRLRLREVPAIVALLPAAAFLAWNLWNAVALATLAGRGAMLVAVLVGAAATARLIVGVARWRRVGDPA